MILNVSKTLLKIYDDISFKATPNRHYIIKLLQGKGLEF